MDRADGRRIEDGLIDFLHHRNSARSFRSNHDTVGMKEVADRGAFTEKFRVGDDVKFQAIDIVNREMLPEAFRSLHRHGAFFDH